MPDITSDITTVVPGLVVDSFGGGLPFQAGGTIEGYPFHLRERHGSARLEVFAPRASDREPLWSSRMRVPEFRTISVSAEEAAGNPVDPERPDADEPWLDTLVNLVATLEPTSSKDAGPVPFELVVPEGWRTDGADEGVQAGYPSMGAIVTPWRAGDTTIVRDWDYEAWCHRCAAVKECADRIAREVAAARLPVTMDTWFDEPPADPYGWEQLRDEVVRIASSRRGGLPDGRDTAERRSGCVMAALVAVSLDEGCDSMHRSRAAEALLKLFGDIRP